MKRRRNAARRRSGTATVELAVCLPVLTGLVFGSIEGPVAKILESRLDDGRPDSGRIQSDLTAALLDGSAISSAGATYVDDTRYFMGFRI